MNDLRSTYRSIALQTPTPASETDSIAPANPSTAPDVSTVSTSANKTPVVAASPLYTPSSASNPSTTPPFAASDPFNGLNASSPLRILSTALTPP